MCDDFILFFFCRTNEVELKHLSELVQFNISNFNITNTEYVSYNTTKTEDTYRDNLQYHIGVYSLCLVACIIMINIRAILHFKFCMNSSKALHKKMFSCVLQAPMRFFDTNPSGKNLFVFLRNTSFFLKMEK